MNTPTLIETAASWFEAMTVLSIKGALIGLAACLLLFVCGRRLSPAWRHGIWVLVLLRFCVPDLGAFRWSLAGMVEAPEAPISIEMPVAEPVASFSDESVLAPLPVKPPVLSEMPSQMLLRDVEALPSASWSNRQWLALGWLSGVALVLGLMLVFHVKLRLRLRRESREPDEETWNLLRQACDLAGVTRMPRVMESAGCTSPALFGVLRPVILLPADLVRRADAASVRVIFLHELAHLRRRDLWTQIFASLVVAIHWFNPVAWLAARFLRVEAEMAADEKALKRTEPAAAHRLGEAVLAFATRMPAVWALWMTSAALLGISGCQRDLRRRFRALTDVAKGRKAWWSAGLAVFVTLAVTGLTRSADEKPAAAAQTTVVEGLVVDEAGKPVEGAHCHLTIEAGVPLVAFDRQQSGIDGRFRFEKVPHPSILKLSVSHQDMRTVRSEFASADEKVEKKLTLSRTAYISGRVTRKADGTPVKGALVYLGTETSISSLPFRWDSRGARTDADGRYLMPNTISKERAVQARDKAQLLRVEATGMAPFITTLPLDEDSLTADAVLEPKKVLNGILVDAKDQPVSKALVWVVEQSANLVKDVTAEYVARQAKSSSPASGLALNKSFTDDSGAFQLKEVAPLAKEKLWIYALHQTGVARLPVRDLKPGMRLKLSPWNQVKGRLTQPDGKPQAGVEVMLSYLGNGEVDPASSLSPFTQQARLVTDADGRFEHDQGLPHAFLGVRVAGNASPVASARLGEGGTHDLKLQTNGKEPAPVTALRPVKGRLVFPSGHGFLSDRYTISANVTRRQGGDGRLALGFIRPDAQGNFITQPMPPGIYDVVVIISPKDRSLTPVRVGSINRAAFKLEPGSSQVPFDVKDVVLDAKDFEFKLRKMPALPLPAGPQGVAKVRVVDGGGAPFAGVRLEARSLVDVEQNLLPTEGKEANISPVVTDADGRASITFPRDLPDGSQVAGIRAHAYAPDGASAFTNEPLSEGAEKQIVVERAVRLNLEVAGALKPLVWSAASSSVTRRDNQQVENGRLSAGMSLKKDDSLVIGAGMADGSWHFSDAMDVTAAPGTEMSGSVTLKPGVVVQGLVKDLPADYDGTGWAVADVQTVPKVQSGKARPGKLPIHWVAWTPVAKDGRFKFPGLPSGKLKLSAAGDGWLTHSPNAAGCDWSGEIESGQPVLTPAFEIQRCGEKRVRLLLPDGKPAAGTIVHVRSFGDITFTSRIWHRSASAPLHYVRPEDAEAYARFCQGTLPGHRAVADAGGWVTLGNQPEYGTSCNVLWAEPETRKPRRDYVKLNGPAKEHEVKLGLSSSF
ncbi:MAG: hypothetical protein HS117_01355 [Verrucomicrobiaceae bacterium]|nr:hypothetical protein [Verrucomicrobiaceae bacterium]